MMSLSSLAGRSSKCVNRHERGGTLLNQGSKWNVREKNTHSMEIINKIILKRLMMLHSTNVFFHSKDHVLVHFTITNCMSCHQLSFTVQLKVRCTYKDTPGFRGILLIADILNPHTLHSCPVTDVSLCIK